MICTTKIHRAYFTYLLTVKHADDRKYSEWVSEADFHIPLNILQRRFFPDNELD